MSTGTQPPSETELGEDEQRLRAFLEREVAEGEVYFKSKFVAEEVGLSPKQIGALMYKLDGSAPEFEIEKWSYTSATTWRVARA
jgi:hypothetical protein